MNSFAGLIGRKWQEFLKVYLGCATDVGKTYVML